MKSTLFQHEVNKTSTIFGRDEKVKVVFQGDQACTDGNTITIPTLDDTQDIPVEKQQIIRGYVDHEAGHVRHTDFSVLHDNQKLFARDNLLAQCNNALEDIWLERKVISEYAGAEKNLRAVSSAVNKEFLDSIDKDDERIEDPKFIGPVSLTWEGRKDYGGEGNQECIDLLPKDFANKLPTYIKGLDACKDSKDVFTLAKIIRNQFSSDKPMSEEEFDELVKEAIKDKTKSVSVPAEHEIEGASDDSREGEDGSSGSSGDGKEKSDKTSSGGDESTREEGNDDWKSDHESEHDETPTAHSGGSGVGAEERATTAETYENFDVGTILQKEISDYTSRSGGGVYRPFSTAFDKWHHRTDEHGKYGSYDTLGHSILSHGRPAKYDRILSQSSGPINVMRRKLERCLLAKQNRDWLGNQEDGRLDTRRLVGAFNGSANVFRQRSPLQELDTAVTVLIDLSGSMHGSRAYLAMQASICLAEALERTGCAYSVYGFNNQSSMSWEKLTEEQREDYYSGSWSRTECMDMFIFKDFQERLHDCKGAMSRIADCSNGNNSDGESILKAYGKLKNRRESRKVYLVMSDGYPACHTNCTETLYQHTRDAVKTVEDDGVDIIGIGIESKAVSRFYPKYVVLDKVEDLSGAVMDKLSKALLGERFEIDNSVLLNA